MNIVAQELEKRYPDDYKNSAGIDSIKDFCAGQGVQWPWENQ